jgi:hypothetical protein
LAYSAYEATYPRCWALVGYPIAVAERATRARNPGARLKPGTARVRDVALYSAGGDSGFELGS